MKYPLELCEFVEWGLDNYEAEHYALIIGCHGDGIAGLHINDESHNVLTMTELGDALAQIMAYNNDTPLDLLGFDACLMAMIEVDYEIADYVDYIVSSEETLLGWNHENILTDLVNYPTMSPEALAGMIVDEYQSEFSTETNLTLSAKNCSKVAGLADAVDAFAQVLTGCTDTEYDNIADAGESVDYYDTENYVYVDLYHLADLIRQGTSDPDVIDAADGVLLNGVTGTVLSNWHTTDPWHMNAHGISIYFPLYHDTCNETLYSAFSFHSKNWDEFLNAFYDGGEPEDAGNDFASATELSGDEIDNGHTETLDENADPEDYFKISLYLDETITVTMTGPPGFRLRSVSV